MYKSKLQELCHQYSWNLPEYVSVKDGPDHNPRFTSTVFVNGVHFETPPNLFRSSKEAQNQVAKLAFEHFSVPKPILQSSMVPSPLPNVPNLGFSASTSSTDIGASKHGIMVLDQPKNAPNILVGETPLFVNDQQSSKDMLHLYKSRLQNYTQKRNLPLPTYTCEVMGPPHDRRFKSKVTVDGKEYGTSNFHTTLKEAEHAAAKAAFESLSLDEIQEDEGLYKSRLQELAQKEGFCFPLYETARSGPPHTPTFVSTVEIGGDIFHGNEAKTKKQAEMNAAKAAYTSLIQRRARPHSSNFHMKVDPEFSSLNLQPNVTAEMGPKVMPETNSAIQEDLAKEDKETDANANKHGCSSHSINIYAPLQNPNPATFSPPKEAPLPSPSPVYATKTEESDIKISSWAGTSAVKKILVRPRKPNMTFEDGAIVLPISDDKWVAVSMDANQNK